MRRKLKGGIGKRLTKKDIENRQRAFFTTQRRSRHRDMSPKTSAIGARAKRLEKQWAREKKEEEGMAKRSTSRAGKSQITTSFQRAHANATMAKAPARK